MKLLTLALFYIRTVLLRRSSILQLVIIPLILTAVVGQATSPSRGTHQALLAVVEEQPSQLGTLLIDLLRSEPGVTSERFSKARAEEALDQGAIAGMLVVPADLATTLAAGQPLSLAYQRSASRTDSPIVQAGIENVLVKLGGTIEAQAQAAAALAKLGITPPQADQTLSLWKTAPPVTVAVATVQASQASATVGQGVNQSSPGLLVMFTLLFMLNGANTLLYERDFGTLRRLLIMPMSAATILAGKLLGMFLGGMVQIGLLITAGSLFFHVPWGQSPLALATLVVCFALAATGFSLMMAALVRTRLQLSAISLLCVLVMSALGGCWWPLQIMPQWLQVIGYCFPTAWAMLGFSNIIARGMDVVAILPQALALLGFAVGFFLVGVARFRYL